MDGSAYTALVGDFGPVITLIVVIAAALIAVLRLGVKFDVSELLKMRKQRHARLARANCTHMTLAICEDGVEVEPLWYSPYGTPDWVCSRCGAVSHTSPDDEKIKRTAEYYINNPEEYLKQTKRFEKHAKKSY